MAAQDTLAAGILNIRTFHEYMKVYLVSVLIVHQPENQQMYYDQTQ